MVMAGAKILKGAGKVFKKIKAVKDAKKGAGGGSSGSTGKSAPQTIPGPVVPLRIAPWRYADIGADSMSFSPVGIGALSAAQKKKLKRGALAVLVPGSGTAMLAARLAKKAKAKNAARTPEEKKRRAKVAAGVLGALTGGAALGVMAGRLSKKRALAKKINVPASIKATDAAGKKEKLSFIKRMRLLIAAKKAKRLSDKQYASEKEKLSAAYKRRAGKVKSQRSSLVETIRARRAARAKKKISTLEKRLAAQKKRALSLDPNRPKLSGKVQILTVA
jgi:hypothetical protein